MQDYNIQITRVNDIVFSKAGNNPHDVYCPTRKNHGIQLRISGSSEFTFGERTIKTVRGDVLYLPQGLEYTVSNRTGGECLAINFETADSYEKAVHLIKPHFRERFQLLLADGVRRSEPSLPSSESSRFAVAYSVLSLFQKALEAEYFPSDKFSKIKPALLFLEKCDDLSNVSIEILSDKCKMSPVYFRRLFYMAYGMNPQKYVELYRLERAKRIIESGMYIKDAAKAAGYNDTSYFCKVFKRNLGFTPGEYSDSIVT